VFVEEVFVVERVGRMKKKHDNGHDAAKFFTTLDYQLATARSDLAASVGYMRPPRYLLQCVNIGSTTSSYSQVGR